MKHRKRRRGTRQIVTTTKHLHQSPGKAHGELRLHSSWSADDALLILLACCAMLLLPDECAWMVNALAVVELLRRI